MGRLTAALVALVLSMAALAACGDDDDGGGGGSERSGGDFTAQVNEACRARAEASVEGNLAVPGGPPSAKKDFANLTEHQIPAREEFVATLRELEPPADLKARYDRYVAANEDLLAAYRAQVKAYETKGERAFAEAGAKTSAQGDEVRAIVEKLPFDDCALRLPEDDAKAATAAVEQFATTADPKTSCDVAGGLVTEQMIDSLGGSERCIKDQKGIADELPSRIKVTEVTGMDDILATVEFEDVGGRYDGDPSVANVYYIDGSWKLYSVTLAS